MKILVAGGGTAGHIAPVLAVIASIRALNKEAEILFVCSKKSQETALLKSNGIEYKIIPSGKFRRYGRGPIKEALDVKTQSKNLADMGRVLRGYIYSRKIIKQFKPDVVFVKGGYVGLPVGLAANSLKVPVIIHESDIVMGKTNATLAKKARFVAVSFPVEAYRGLDPAKLKFTGNPVRPEFYPASDTKPKALNKQKPNIMIFAGSQGAESINSNVFENIEILTKNFHLLHITGEQGIERARFVKHRMPKELQKFYDPVDFLSNEMAAAYKWSDVVVARGGMNSLSELAALSKPAIIIPLPSSTNNHQFKNASYLAQHGAVRILDQSSVKGLGLVNEISKLFDRPETIEYLSETVHKFFKASAALDIARLVISVAEEKK
jgi:UDP-N-acetylglucosamine--N-acetylmuramyl-(pentapeptide) pyrophosphoryl-undecaprenol N-acetylglucosamine transferase